MFLHFTYHSSFIYVITIIKFREMLSNLFLINFIYLFNNHHRYPRFRRLQHINVSASFLKIDIVDVNKFY